MSTVGSHANTPPPAPSGAARRTAVGQRLVRAGGLLLMVAVCLGVWALIAGAPLLTTDIEDEARYAVDVPGSVELAEGSYRMWFEFPDGRPTDEGVAAVIASTGLSIHTPEDVPVSVEATDLGENFLDFSAFGDIRVEAGVHRFDGDATITLFLTEPLTSSDDAFWALFWRMAAAVATAAIALAVLLLGATRRQVPA